MDGSDGYRFVIHGVDDLVAGVPATLTYEVWRGAEPAEAALREAWSGLDGAYGGGFCTVAMQHVHEVGHTFTQAGEFLLRLSVNADGDTSCDEKGWVESAWAETTVDIQEERSLPVPSVPTGLAVGLLCVFLILRRASATDTP